MFRDSASAVKFNSLGRYSAVIVISYFKRYSHISLANSTIFRFLVPPIFIKYVKATILSTWRCIALTSLYFVNVYMASFTANNSRILM